MVSRLSSRKDWKAEFSARMAANFERSIAQKQVVEMAEQKASVINTDIASNFIVEIIGQREDMVDKMIKKSMCRHNLENLVPPSKPLPWSTTWGSNVLCEVCSLPAVTDCSICQKCNAVTHKQCLVDTGQSPESYDCPSCLESIRIEDEYYKSMLRRLEHERRIERDARKIAKQLVVVVERKRLRKKRVAAIAIQKTVRRFLALRRYKKWLRAQLRLVTVKLSYIPSMLLQDGVVVMTVYDTLKNAQSFRLDATAEGAMKQGFLIPGVAANMSLLFTIARKDESVDGRRQYVILGQAQLFLRDVAAFTKRATFDVNFVEKVKWIPTETKGEFKYHLVPYAATRDCATPGIPASVNFGSAASVAGSTTSSLPHISASVRYGGSGASVASLFSHAGSFNGGSSVSVGLNGGSVFGNGSISTGWGGGSMVSMATANVNPAARSAFAVERRCSITYYPQNPVINVVAMCNGPPLDVLRRPPEIGMKKNKTGAGVANYRNSRYWLCLYRLKLVFFQYYGDITPRLVADVSEATAVLILDTKGRKTTLVNVVHADSRSWLLEFDSRKEACKFELALNESRKACSEGGSIYARKSEITAAEAQYDFRVPQIY